jgi:predicted alpha/beta-hydrolase family hydrolase
MIRWSGGRVTARTAGEGEVGVLLAHGAGTNQDHPTIVATRKALAEENLSVMSFNYPYSEAGRSAPDSQAKLLECHRAALAALRKRVQGGVVLAGRSMGGRMGTYLAAEGDVVLGLVCYAYPLHPPGKPEKLRVEHLPQIKVPMLFFQGKRDALSHGHLFDLHVRTLPTATVIDMEVDHSLGGVKTVPFLAAKTAEWIRAET